MKDHIGATRRVARIVSGGQTGVDRAALDVAMELGLACGGWCPRGRRAEDGPIAKRYPLAETAGWDYAERTGLNVRDSDGTLVLSRGEPTGGTGLTLDLARALKRPAITVDLEASNREIDVGRVRDWIAAEAIAVLNVAGPRDSTAPGIYAQAVGFLKALLS